MRKEQDYYFKKAKKENYPARSVYKLEEAQVKYRFLRPGQRVLDLGCHPGSWSLYAAGIVGAKGLVVGVDLQRTDLAAQKADAEIQWLCYDVYSDEFVEYLQAHWPGFHVVLSDMAPHPGPALTRVQRGAASALAHLAKRLRYFWTAVQILWAVVQIHPSGGRRP